MTPSPSPDLEYWTSRLQDKEPCLFPTLIGGARDPGKSGCVDISLPELASISAFCQNNELLPLTIFQTAWGLVLRSYTGADNVSFGFKADHIQILPCNMALVRETSIRHALDSAETNFTRDSSHGNCSLADLEDALRLEESRLFNTALHYREGEASDILPLAGDVADATMNSVGIVGGEGSASLSSRQYDIEICVEVHASNRSISARLKYRTSTLSRGSAVNVGSALEMALRGILHHTDVAIGDQNLFSLHHQQQVNQWNEARPTTMNMTLHAAIAERCKKQPGAPAVNAWDEKWTFREVDNLSSTLALHLVNLGVKTGMKIPLVFERSGWWVIALLAVSKAGAAFVPVEPKQPLFRLKEIIEDIEPKFLLSSDLHAKLLADVVENTVVVSPRSMKAIALAPIPAITLPDVSPGAHAYVMFTSGSTGRPKGAVLQHGGYLAALLCWLNDTSIGPGTMALQASSYAWSVCIIETICSLWRGACLCIPSDQAKLNDFAGVFNEMQITWAILSPSIIKSVQPEHAPLLESLILCGEPVSNEVVARWASGHTKVWVAWAATECLAICRPDNFTADSNVKNLGPCKGLCRVVDVKNPDRQVPIGAIGEIVVHGPWIADGYLKDAERTSRTFLDRPNWLNGVPSLYGSKWYRVGDLVRQNADGSLMLAGRGDAMVKIRGQRFDMSEIERNLAADVRIRNSLPVLPKIGVCKNRLVAVVALHQFDSANKQSDGDFVVLTGDELQTAAHWVSNFREALARRLPSYAIPTIWVMVNFIPLTITGKIDRVSLKRFIERMDVTTYEKVSALGVQSEPPITPMERCLQKIWSSVLSLSYDKIGRNQSFISLGGDSITAMIVRAKCRTENLSLRVEDILKLGSIAEIALRTSPVAPSNEKDVMAAEKYTELRQSIKEQLHQRGLTNSANIEDAYPCSPMQQGMLLSKARLTGDYNTSTIYELTSLVHGSTLEVDQLKSAWQLVVDRHASLRTFFVESGLQTGSFDQVVLKSYNTSPMMSVLSKISAYSKEDAIKVLERSHPPKYEGYWPPHNFTILPTTSGKLFCRLNIEHTLVDGMSLAIIVRDLNLAYHNLLDPEPPALYSSYIAKLQGVVCSIDNSYWKGYLDKMNPCILPNLTYSLSRESPKAESRSLAVDIKNPHHLLKFCQSQDLTLSALLRAIWSVILRKYTGSDDVCFGFITSGRDLPVNSIGEIVGTFINMLVCRMKLDDSIPFRNIIATAQADYLCSLPHQHASLAQIQHVLGLYGQPLFNTSMTVLKEVPLNCSSDSSLVIKNIHEFSPNEYDLDVQVWVSNSNVRMELWYRTESISSEHATNIASTFTRALDTITDDLDQRLGQLDLFSDHHRDQVWKWNSTMPPAINTCLHDLVSIQSQRRPQAVAIISWEQELTWTQLETYSNTLAHYLVSLGIGPEIHVMVCFEKSALAIVAMLATLKAGGVVVSVDASHPIQRLQRIVSDTNPLCCLASSLHSGLFEDGGLKGLIPHVVEVQQSLFSAVSLSNLPSGQACPSVRPHNAAFVLFTSGTTGTPKGIVHEHRAVASSLEHHGKAMSIDAGSRTMQFSAFVFDVSITEIFMSLTRGGVLCIPSEDERMNGLESAFNRMGANWAHLTPTVASLLVPDKVPTLRHLALAGEPLKKVNINDWAPKLQLINLYGPAECALATTIRVGCDRDDRPDNIGRAVGLLVWIIDPSNTDHLAPVGAVGEILLEGPNIAREYLKDKDRTISSFIENPAWLHEERSIPPRRFYRSGDLARYNGDGSIQILGRIDTQVKLHGQRVELGEIEYQVKMNLSPHGLTNMAVVYAKSTEHAAGGFLSVFLEFKEGVAHFDESQIPKTIPMHLRTILVKLKSHLSDTLPSYMVPAIFVPLHQMPLLTAGKIDRSELTRIAMQLSPEESRLYALSELRDEKGSPRTRMERLFCQLWADVLNADARTIGTGDSFFRIGGDSVVAMRLSAAGRKAGVTITVANIFQNSKLSDMATVAKPFSENTFQQLEKSHTIRREIVQHIFPCTPLQEGLMIVSSRLPGTYTTQHIFYLPPTVVVQRFAAAWQLVHTSCPILRTRIISVQGMIGTIQVVVDEGISWRRAVNLQQYLERDKSLPMVYGEQLTRYALVNEEQSGNQYFVWTAHHSVFDSRSLSLLFSEVQNAYESLASVAHPNADFSKSSPYKQFVDHVFNSDISEAEHFWNVKLLEAAVSSFPKLPTGHDPLADSSLDHHIALPSSTMENIDRLSTVLQSAWSLLLAQYSDSSTDVTFGMTFDGRIPPECISEVGNVIGPTIATVPVTISIDYTLTIEQFLDYVQKDAAAIQQFQHFGLQSIRGLGPSAAKACDFQSLLAIQAPSPEYTTENSSLFANCITRVSPSTLLMLLDCKFTANGVAVTAQFDEKVTTHSQMKRILHQLEHVVKELIQGDGFPRHLADIDFCGPEDTKHIQSWNDCLPSVIDKCIHEVIANYSFANPEEMAVCSWDGNLTYSELDQLSTTLANHLASRFGVGPEVLVPLAFTQSTWAIVAMLAVLKAGGGYVPMDPSYPVVRLQGIVDSSQCTIILCSPRYEDLSHSLKRHAFVVDREAIYSLHPFKGALASPVSSRNVAYVIFTSGSTGAPKGVVMEHRSFCTAATDHGKRLNLNSQSRVIHFSSYAFEACILEILTTLFNGGCVCVAPESERLGDISRFMREFRVNWAFFTPSFVRTIHPDQVPDLKTLVLGGEALGADNIDIWVDRVFLVNGYGPSETCVFSVINANVYRGVAPDLIGSPIGCACWIVDPDNHQKLVPVGCVGELLIEGPTLARGYLDDPVKTGEAFMKPPRLLGRKHVKDSENSYLANGSADRFKTHINGDHRPGKGTSITRRIYRTGDLVRYNTSPAADGTIRIVGRKDAQVKIRGQRTEMGDIEHHLKSNLIGIQHVAVEYVAVGGRENRQLVAFVPVASEAPVRFAGGASLAIPMSSDLKRSIITTKTALLETIPSYMIPTLYITLSTMPLLSSGKTDRQALREISSGLSDGDISCYSLSDDQKRVPQSDKEVLMSKFWKQILILSDDVSIGLDDSFFGLGGDSISAMRLTTLAREHKSAITVAQIFQHPRLEDMAITMVDLDDGGSDTVVPFSLMEEHHNHEGQLTTIQQLQDIYAGDIADAFPCGPLQEGLMLLSIKHPGSYMSQITLRLRPHVEVSRLKAAWQATADRHSILRTRIAYVGSQCIQFITKDTINWQHGTNLATFLSEDKEELMGHGSALVRYTIIDSGTGKNDRYFILTAHHSLYDGWSLMLIMEDLDHFYHNNNLEKPAAPYAGFIKHLKTIDPFAAETFWKSTFENRLLRTFPEPRFVTPAEVETQLSQSMSISRPAGSEITLSTVIRGAWALVTARYAETDDVFFGATLMGRNASLPHIDRLTGPTITTVPVCVSIDLARTVGQYLHGIQHEATNMMPFEHTGLQNIKRMGPEAEAACSFQNLLVIQPEGSENMSSDMWEDQALFARGEMVVLTYALIVECRLYKDKIRITAQYRDHIIPTLQMQRIMDQFEEVLLQLNDASPENILGCVDICSTKDKKELRAWNECRANITRAEHCIHDLIQQQAIHQPRAQAIESWDGNFTYEDLDNLSTRLAHHLSALGACPGCFIPLCFDKSAWTVVAILAVLKVGAAYVSLDPKHPQTRRDHIIQEVSAKIILTAPQYQNFFDSKFSIVIIDQALANLLSGLSHAAYSPGLPSNAAFVVFTSGSTGTPKGIIMEHGAFCSSSIEHRKALRITNSSRVMQFAAYTYDVSMGEILSTLMQGACICIPSEEDRLSRLAIAINKLRADWIFLTPTVAALLEPQDVPHLKTMVLGGEHATVDNFKNWASRLCLINSYGPAECAIWCACNPAVSHTTDSSNIGRPVGAFLWVVDPSDPEKLAPIGCVGELVVEGPTLARGYLNDPAKTTATFIENPKWSGGPDTGYRRMYRTGDLVRYNPTGDLVIIGRRDTQVKFHGQRIELGEIEHHIIGCSPPGWIPVVHLLDLSRNGRGPTLVTFVHVRNNTATSMISSVATLPVTGNMRVSINQLRSDLERLLPSYMVPTVYIPVTHLPLTAGGKVDRGALQNIGERLTAEELHPYLLANLVARRPPSTVMEKKLQLLWAKVLNLDANFVGAESNFLRVGGDSVAAMRLSAAAREDLISLDVRDIFGSPRLEDMSRCTRSMSAAPVTQDAQFASLKTHDLSEFLRTVIYPQIPTHPDSIEDILVATDYQRWVIGCGQLKTKGYNNYFTLRFKGALDLPQLQTACELLLARHPILRTVFIAHKRQLFQVVLRHVVPQFIYRSCQDDPVVRRSVLEADMALPVVLGQASIRFILLVYGTSEHELIMRVSHSQYDGISLPILIKDLKAAYLQKNFCTSLPYSAFIYGLSSITRSSEAEEYWRNVLQDSTMTAILAHTRPTYSHAIDTSLKRVVRALSVLPEEITPATAVKTAWAFTLAQISGCVDVTFGQITTGRNAPIRGIDKVVGPCMNLVPVRVKLNPKISLSRVAREIQSQHLEMSAYEYLGFQGIIDNCTNWPKWTRMSSILQHTNFNVGMNNMDMWGGTEMHLGNFTPDHDVSDIWIWTGPAADGLSVDFTYSSSAIPADTAQEIFERFCENISRISETQDMPASELFLLDAKDLLPLPLPVRNGSDAVLGILTDHSSNMLAAVVQDTWSKVFGDEHNQIPNGISLDTPFYEIRGDLLAASQLSAAYKQRGFTVCEEEVIDNPSRPLQASLLASKQVVE